MKDKRFQVWKKMLVHDSSDKDIETGRKHGIDRQIL